MRRGLQLTDTGHTVYGYTQRIFALAEEMQAAVEDIQGMRRGRLTIGSSTTPGEYILPWVIGQFRKKYSGIEVSLSITNTKDIIQRVLDHEFDIGMAGAVVNMKGLHCFNYVDDEIVIIAPPDHPLSEMPVVTLEDVDGQDFVMREQGSATREAAEAGLNAHGVSISVCMELGSNEAVKRAVASGLGLGMISRFGVSPDTVAGMIKVLTVEGWNCRRPLTVFHRDNDNLLSAQRAFLKFLQERPVLADTPASSG
jgi:DNA-binding transcriptional LysR family regulator